MDGPVLKHTRWQGGRHAAGRRRRRLLPSLLLGPAGQAAEKMRLRRASERGREGVAAATGAGRPTQSSRSKRAQSRAAAAAAAAPLVHMHQ